LRPNQAAKAFLQAKDKFEETSNAFINFNLEAETKKTRNAILEANLSTDELLHVAAHFMAESYRASLGESLLFQYLELKDLERDCAQGSGGKASKIHTFSEEQLGALIQDLLNASSALSLHDYRKRRAKSAAHSRHSKIGGSREKRDQIREIWSSGKYTSRDICAEQECAGLDMSFSSARKALRNTPDPEFEK
jgi:hypothetical protein